MYGHGDGKREPAHVRNARRRQALIDSGIKITTNDERNYLQLVGGY